MNTLAIDVGTRHTALSAYRGKVLAYVRYFDGQKVDIISAISDELRRWSPEDTIVAIEDATSYGEAKSGIMKLVALVNRLEGFALRGGFHVVKMTRVQVLRKLRIAGAGGSGMKLTKRQIKRRCQALMESLTKVRFENDHCADSAALGWVFAHGLAPLGRRFS